MGNTPLQSKRRLSGDMDAFSCENTPPHIAVDIPAKRRTLCDSSSYPRSAPLDCPFDKLPQDGQLAVDNMAWLLHGTSLQDGYTNDQQLGTTVPSGPTSTGPSRPTRLAVESAGVAGQSVSASDLPTYVDTVTNSRERRPLIVNSSAVGSDVEMTPTSAAPHQKLLPTVFRWNGGGTEVSVSGTFNDWHSRIPLVRKNSGAYVIVDIPPGKHEYKFFIDGAWYHDPGKPTVDNRYGTKNNVVEVKESDFNFLNAIEQDIANSKHKADSSNNSDIESRTPPGEYGCFIPEQPKDVYGLKVPYSPRRLPPFTPPAPGIGSINQPPLLPPQLLQGILNKDVGVHCDPNLLPPPNHVMVNHLYALSIKDGVIVLSVITRYRQKFVSTLFYKPIPN
ncbi:unnamed protein product [Schistocephalus solidus]|uniref:5'-AMP-activated protein kinase subunit beta-1 n=1 Tax=Schistocephalus solidus TaxID=70667 RepID=A0A0X3PBX8_SCHSO|nr:unnamed protein product [Schistocephalus solidus]